ncbi:helix-turn-helix domain-containing protein [Janibacter sp. GS2]|uniref:helix-turn-helix domain-containing protein n=1 Tax=Janibacter sp. GS2 TaxID=3442646 RepID=UPI003EB86690
MSAEGSQTLDRGLRILEELAREDGSDGMTISAIAASVGTGRAVVYRLVATLEEHQLVTRQGGRIRLGLGMHRLAGAVVPALRERARPVLAALADTAAATAHLSVAEGDEAVAIVVVEPSGTDFHVGYRTGSRHPLERGAAGRAILMARQGGPVAVSSAGELQSGAHGLALAVPKGATPFEASVGVVSLRPLDEQVVGPHLRAAVRLVTTSR